MNTSPNDYSFHNFNFSYKLMYSELYLWEVKHNIAEISNHIFVVYYLAA